MTTTTIKTAEILLNLTAPQNYHNHIDDQVRMALILQRSQKLANKLKLQRQTEQINQRLFQQQFHNLDKNPTDTATIPKPLIPILTAPTMAHLTPIATISPILHEKNPTPNSLPINLVGNSEFKCPFCLVAYRSQAFLNEHMRKEHSVLI